LCTQLFQALFHFTMWLFDVVSAVYFGFRFESRLSKVPIVIP
jgi:hypothetical protein